MSLAFLLLAVPARAEAARPGPALELTLEDYTRMALEDSLRMQTVRDNLRLSRYGRDATLSSLSLPSLTANADADRFDPLGDPARTDSANASLNLSQPLLTGTDLSLRAVWNLAESRSGGSVTSRTHQLPDVDGTLTQPVYLFVRNPRQRAKTRALIAWDNARDQFRGEELSVTFEARGLYYAALLQKDSVEVEQRKLASARAVHRITRELVGAGKLAPVELARADLRLKRDVRRVQTAGIQTEQALNDLKNFILLPATAPVRLASGLRYVPFEAPLEALLQETLRKNPSVLNSRRQIKLAAISLQESREGRRPDVSLSGTYSFTRDVSVAGNVSEPASWNAGVGLSWPLYDARQTRFQVRQAEVSLENARRGYESQERQATLAVRNAYLELKRIEEQIRDFSEQRDVARRNVEAIRLQYKNGLARLIDVFDAENERRDLEIEYLNLLVTFNRSRDNLSRQVGVDIAEPAP